jgi:LPXTG-motif cell wall-anchored protein
VLSSISPQLANLVKIDLLKKATNVSQNGSYVNSIASITGLVAKVTPPDICALLNDVLSQLPVGGNSLPGVTLPATPIPGLLSTLGSLLTCNLPTFALDTEAIVPGVPALTGPVTLTAADVNSVASFAATPGQTPPTTDLNNPNNPPTTTTTTSSPALPRTGSNDALFLVVGALLAVAALATRRTLVAARARR